MLNEPDILYETMEIGRKIDYGYYIIYYKYYKSRSRDFKLTKYFRNEIELILDILLKLLCYSINYDKSIVRFVKLINDFKADT